MSEYYSPAVRRIIPLIRAGVSVDVVWSPETPSAALMARPVHILILGLRTEQDLYVRLIDSMSKQVSQPREYSGQPRPLILHHLSPLGLSECCLPCPYLPHAFHPFS
jgi:hypothetical protein